MVVVVFGAVFVGSSYFLLAFCGPCYVAALLPGIALAYCATLQYTDWSCDPPDVQSMCHGRVQWMTESGTMAEVADGRQMSENGSVLVAVPVPLAARPGMQEFSLSGQSALSDSSPLQHPELEPEPLERLPANSSSLQQAELEPEPESSESLPGQCAHVW